MSATHSIALNVNGEFRNVQIDAQDRLADVLRDQCQLTGTNQACDTAQCGACTVLLAGQAIKACNLLAVQAQGHAIVSIEGLQVGMKLHPMQQAFAHHEALQCGYCTPGMILRAVSMHAEGIEPEETAVRKALAGNLCRCTGYDAIVRAIVDGLLAMRELPDGAN
jgi:aerobic carbon-monoxide dehydrogenase small subunit